MSFKTLRAFKLSLSQLDEEEKPVTEDTRCNHNLSFKTLRALKLSLSQCYGKENLSQKTHGVVATCLVSTIHFSQWYGKENCHTRHKV